MGCGALRASSSVRRKLECTAAMQIDCSDVISNSMHASNAT